MIPDSTVKKTEVLAQNLNNLLTIKKNIYLEKSEEESVKSITEIHEYDPIQATPFY